MIARDLIIWLQEADPEAEVFVAVDQADFALVRFVGTPVTQVRRQLTHVTEAVDKLHVYLEGRV